MATLHALPGAALRTDCQSLPRVFQNSRKEATSGSRRFARYGLAFLQPWTMLKRAA